LVEVGGIGEMAYRVFISHAQKDSGFSKKLAQRLSANKYIRVYRADDKLEPGSKITPRLLAEIKRSHLAVVVWSKNSRLSNWVSIEIGMALAQKVPILLLLLDKRTKSPSYFADIKGVTGFGESGVINNATEIIQRRAKRKEDLENAHLRKRWRASKKQREIDDGNDDYYDPGYEEYLDSLGDSESERYEDS
jgi:hypothetical protein